MVQTRSCSSLTKEEDSCAKYAYNFGWGFSSRLVPTRSRSSLTKKEDSCPKYVLEKYGMMQTRSRSSLIKEEHADKFSKKRSASSQRIEIPFQLYMLADLARDCEKKLKACPSDVASERYLAGYEEEIAIYAKRYKASGQLSPNWEYRPDTLSTCVPVRFCLVSPKQKIKKNVPWNKHIESFPLDEKARLAWQNFIKLDEQLKTKSLAGLPCPMDKKLLTRLDKDNEFVTYIFYFAVDVFNKSCRMYRNEENKKNIISRAQVEDCNYLKLLSYFLFYIDIEAFEQTKYGRYEINLRCDLVNGAIVLDSFCRKGSGTRKNDFITLESIYKTRKADSLTDPEVDYGMSGMVRRTDGYDFYNPRGWDSLWDCHDCI